MAIRTGRDYVKRALRICNAINVGSEPDADEANDGIQLFNDMLGNWATQSLTVPFTASAEYQTVAGQKVYQIGPGADDWDGIRPIAIKDAFIRIPGDTGPLDIPITIMQQDQYAAIPLKDTSSTQPRGLYYEAQYPIGYISLWPVPQGEIGVVLMFDTVFQNVTLETDLQGLPPGYALAAQYNLAKLMAVEYGKEWVKGGNKDMIAVNSLANIKSANIQAPDAIFDPRLIDSRRRTWDYRLG